MKKRITIAYELCVCLAAVFLVYLFCFSKNELYMKGSTQGYVKLEDHSCLVQADAGAPVGITQIYQIHPSEIPADSNAMIFRTVHQNVEVYMDDELVFRLKKDTDSPGSRSPGSRWNTALISLEDQGKEICVKIQPVYKSVTGLVPVFYAGSHFSICMEILRQDFSSLLLSISAIIFGLAFMLFSAYGSHRFSDDRGLLMMGQFAVFIGLWKLADTGLFGMLTGREDVVSNAVFLVLLLLVVPFTQYIRGLLTAKDHWLWNFACIFSIGVFFIVMGMQISGLADFREMLWLDHLSMLFLIVVIVAMLYAEIHKAGWSRRLKVFVICMIFCTAGLGADMIVYYSSGGMSMSNWGIFGFLICIVVLGAMSLMDARRLMAIGMQAKYLEQMAYHDQMTGLYNRAAYAEHIKTKGFMKENCTVLIFDLNNLKYCNDTFGHDKGDLYIITCAGMIRQVFGSDGKCYRLGGDEFCVLLQNSTEQDCEKLVRQLKKETEDWNHRKQEQFTIRIAAGYAVYDGTQDYDIGDTERRADKMMYKDKFQMKQEEAGTNPAREPVS